jgi:hypothetical protein
VYCCGGAEESKGGDGEEEKHGDAAAALPDAVAPAGAPSVHSCGGAEERRDATATGLLRVRTRWRPWDRQAAAARLYGEWRGIVYRAAARICVGSIETK